MSTDPEPRLDGLRAVIDQLETRTHDAEAELRRLEGSVERAGRALAAELVEDRPPPPGGVRESRRAP